MLPFIPLDHRIDEITEHLAHDGSRPVHRISLLLQGLYAIGIQRFLILIIRKEEAEFLSVVL